MSESDQHKIIWHKRKEVTRSFMPSAMACWVYDDSSLTNRLITACSGSFSVKVLQQAWAKPTLNEAQRLGTNYQHLALIREVLLQCDGVPWVFARTVIPLSTLTGREKYLAHLGNRPLGAVLFSEPNMRRDEMEVTRLSAKVGLCKKVLQHYDGNCDTIWGRRSNFYLSNKPLLVNEIFLPNIGECPC